MSDNTTPSPWRLWWDLKGFHLVVRVAGTFIPAALSVVLTYVAANILGYPRFGRQVLTWAVYGFTIVMAIATLVTGVALLQASVDRTVANVVDLCRRGRNDR